ncbi:MAG: hypothetical protein AAB524_01655 [Patescibacteria group bacterium]
MRPYDFLKKLAEQKKLSHAYLFSGNDKKQKNELVRSLLEILCVQSADQIVVSPGEEDNALEITIAQIRSLSTLLSMSAWNSPYKVALLKHAHLMNREAQSAFLKLLEEPKGDTIFFLLTEYPDMLFDTIRSRTQEFKFYSFAPTKVLEHDIIEFQKLQKADLAVRFALAKKLADAAEQISEILDTWLVAARAMLHASVKENPQIAQALVGTIQVIQETSLLLRTTNINPRLALERIMLNLPVSP